MDTSLADIAAVTKSNNCNAFANGEFIWLFAILALMGGGFGGFGYNNRGGEQYATTADVQRATDFAALERQNNETIQAIANNGAAVTAAVKDASYNNLSEVRDLQTAVNAGFANQATCCCETNRNIDSVRFDMANYAAQTNANTTAQVQKVLDAISTNRIADLQQQVNALQLQVATASNVKYPTVSAYTVGVNPFCGCGCQG